MTEHTELPTADPTAPAVTPEPSPEPAPASVPPKTRARTTKAIAVGDTVQLKDKRKGTVKQLGTSGAGALVEIPGTNDGEKFESSWYATAALKVVQA